MKLPRALPNSLQRRKALRLVHSPFVWHKPSHRFAVTSDDYFLTPLDTIEKSP
jgi:hypothetical protein